MKISTLDEISIIDDPIEGYEKLESYIWQNSLEDTFFESNPTAVQEFILMWWFIVDTLNGGLNQYFYNPYSDGALTALSGLRKIGARKISNILESAVELFNSKQYPKERYKR